MYTLKRRYIKGYRGAKNGRKKKTRYKYLVFYYLID